MTLDRKGILLRATAMFKATTLLLCALVVTKAGLALYRDDVIDLRLLVLLVIGSAALYLFSWAGWRAASASERPRP